MKITKKRDTFLGHIVSDAELVRTQIEGGV